MQRELNGIGLIPLRDAIRTEDDARIECSESFTSGEEKIEIAAVSPGATEEGWHVQVSEMIYDWVELTSEVIARRLHMVLETIAGEGIDRNSLLKLPIPADDAGEKAFEEIVTRYGSTDHEAELAAEIDKLNQIVGTALGLNPDEIAFIGKEMGDDPFLKQIRPRYPFTATRLHGYRTGLDSSERYA